MVESRSKQKVPKRKSEEDRKKEKWKKVEYSNSWILLLKKVNTEMGWY